MVIRRSAGQLQRIVGASSRPVAGTVVDFEGSSDLRDHNWKMSHFVLYDYHIAIPLSARANRNIPVPLYLEHHVVLCADRLQALSVCDT